MVLRDDRWQSNSMSACGDMALPAKKQGDEGESLSTVTLPCIQSDNFFPTHADKEFSALIRLYLLMQTLHMFAIFAWLFHQLTSSLMKVWVLSSLLEQGRWRNSKGMSLLSYCQSMSPVTAWGGRMKCVQCHHCHCQDVRDSEDVLLLLLSHLRYVRTRCRHCCCHCHWDKGEYLSANAHLPPSTYPFQPEPTLTVPIQAQMLFPHPTMYVPWAQMVISHL